MVWCYFGGRFIHAIVILDTNSTVLYMLMPVEVAKRADGLLPWCYGEVCLGTPYPPWRGVHNTYFTKEYNILSNVLQYQPL
jgi:hypothetical protein